MNDIVIGILYVGSFVFWVLILSALLYLLNMAINLGAKLASWAFAIIIAIYLSLTVGAAVGHFFDDRLNNADDFDRCTSGETAVTGDLAVTQYYCEDYEWSDD
jgi:hypothetical protein